MKKYGELLKQIRKNSGLSQQELSARTGVSQRYLSYLETNKSSPSRSMVNTLSTGLNVTEEERRTLLFAAGYIEGNRAPIANIKVDKEVGAAPLTVHFSGKESMDYDRDEIKYEWSFDDPSVQSKDKEPQFTFEEVIQGINITLCCAQPHPAAIHR